MAHSLDDCICLIVTANFGAACLVQSLGEVVATFRSVC